MEPGVIDMLSLKMNKGSGNSLGDPSSMIILTSLATSLFGGNNPVGHLLST